MSPEVNSSLLAEAQSETTSPERLRELAKNPNLIEAVAGNVMAPPDLLAELYYKYHQESEELSQGILKACAKNPNTPKETLLKLGSKFLAELINNHVFDLLLVENPKFFLGDALKHSRSYSSITRLPTIFLEFICPRFSSGESKLPGGPTTTT